MMALLDGRFGKGIFISATGTELGKTVLASGIAHWMHIHKLGATALWKPVQSGVELGTVEADSYRLLKGSGLTNVGERELVTWTLREPLAPWAAAKREGLEISMSELVVEGERRLQASDRLVVEGAGGVAVPLQARHTMADLAAALQLPMLIVAAPLLGTVSHTVTAVQYARSRGVKDVAVVFGAMLFKPTAEWNKAAYEQQLHENTEMIELLAEVPVVGAVPYLPHPNRIDEDLWINWRKDWLRETAHLTTLHDWLNARL
ncbi:dethiobiotin synthase [Paenibacillus arenosi]|uniref:ATP-dependent dethiobiotin synthetase BioD n=1 Tax=Paenibacillus arenosi TaxID=2774142 RepID=A0ABR9B6L2_9BACL|nr:dethiobiotin synthase [Paenibacillus arenosi]MBD8500811.1 dethiobiotin synthase [Paenibacillus arenosi]